MPYSPNRCISQEKACYKLSLTASPGAKPKEKTLGTASVVRAVQRAANNRASLGPKAPAEPSAGDSSREDEG